MKREVSEVRTTERNAIEVEWHGPYVFALTFVGRRRVEVGQTVYSRGRLSYIPPAPTRGVVTALYEPYSEYLTSDVVDVLFEGEWATRRLKIEEIDLDPEA